jgi:predicted lipoprotein
MARIERNSATFPVKMTADLATSQVIPYAASAAGVFVCTEGAGKVEWHVTHDPDSPAVPMFDSKNAPVTSDVSAGNAVELPSALFAATYIVGVGVDCEGFLCVSG